MSKPEASAFTPRDFELLVAALSCLKGGELTIDYAQFATKGGFKNANSAKASWHGLKNKLDKIASEATAPIESTAAPANKAPAKKGAAKMKGKIASDAEDDAEAPPATTTTTAAAKKNVGKKRKNASAAEGECDGEIESAPAKSKAKRARRTTRAARAGEHGNAEDSEDGTNGESDGGEKVESDGDVKVESDED